MKTKLTPLRTAIFALAALVAAWMSAAVQAQVVTTLPVFVAPRAMYDFGNGPLEIKVLSGSFGLFTSQGSGLGSTSGSSTTLTLTATPTTPPCVGCIISGTGITSGTTVSAFNGTTTITLSAAMTVAASTPLAWGAACPAAGAGTVAVPQILVQANVGGDLPLYTQARICGAGHVGPGAQVLPFSVGAH